MKKVQLIITAALLTISGAMFADENLDFTMGSISGSVYALGVQVGERLKTEGDYNINIKSGGALGNAILIGTNKAQFGHTSSGLAMAAKNGTEPFKKAYPDLLGIAKVMESSYQFITLKKIPFDSLSEFKRKKYPLKIAVGPKGRENELLTRRILEANGITYKDIESWGGRVEFVAISDANSLIRDGHLDGLTMLSGIPYAPIVEINTSRDLKIISLSDETIDTLNKKYGYIETTIPASTYSNIDYPTHSVAGGVILATNADVSEQTAYRLTEAICSDEAQEELGALSASIKKYLTSVNKCSSGVAIALHPGAKRFFDDAKK